MQLDVLLVVHDLRSGAIARAQALSEVLHDLGHRSRTVAVVGDEVWQPVRGTPFARSCSPVDLAGLSATMADGTDLVIAVKAMPASFGVARRLARRHGVPLLLDTDDPDVEARTLWLPPRAIARRLRKDPATFLRLLMLGWVGRRVPRTVSNPVLQEMYGGEVVPHARRDRGPGRPHTSDQPVIAFIGTARGHKGVRVLRAAVEQLAPEGWRLLVTAEPPADARPWESWVGPHVPDSHALLCASDVVVLPSQPGVGNEEDFGRAQLPLKLVDAMLAARVVVVSDYGPLRWAAGDDAPVFAHGDVADLVTALRPLGDPAVRQRLGDVARQEALARYSPAAVAPALARAVEVALAAAPRRRARVQDRSRSAPPPPDRAASPAPPAPAPATAHLRAR